VTASALYVLIVLFGPILGAHFNPAVTLAMRVRGEVDTRSAVSYVAMQVVAAVVGVAIAHAMFGQALPPRGTHARTGTAPWLSEGIPSFGLLLTILLGARHRPAALPALVAAWIFAAYRFTGSTSFANAAVKLARADPTLCRYSTNGRACVRRRSGCGRAIGNGRGVGIELVAQIDAAIVGAADFPPTTQRLRRQSLQNRKPH
jgi:glycerol uptake facilitator-like aquaporin